MRNNILTLLVGFLVMLGSVMLFKLGLDKMTDAGAATQEAYAKLDVDLDRKAILYRVQSGDTLWGLAERFYGAGRRWSDIAGANGLNADAGLTSGTVIRIPLANQPAPAPLETELDIAGELPPSNRFAFDDGVLSVALAQLGHERFPAGALCVARTSENQRVRISMYDAAAGGEGAPLSIYEAPVDNVLLELIADDITGDGIHEIYTIWHTPADSCTSRVLELFEGELRVLRETPNDPLALQRIRAREAR